MSTRDIVDRLAAANPVPVGAVDERADHLLRTIMLTPRAARPRVPRRLVLAGAAGAATLVGVTVAVWPTGTAAFALTPQLLNYRPDGASAADVLRELARRAESQPAPIQDRYFYIRMQSYGLDITVKGDGTGTSTVRVTQDERWLAGDGSGRSVGVEGRAKVGPVGDEATRKAVTFRPDPRYDQRFGPGGLSGVADLSRLSTDPAVLAGQLARDNTRFAWSNSPPEGAVPDWYRRFVIAPAIAKQQVVPPALWAAMLRVLATTPGLTSQGVVPDRVGRRAVAVSVDTTYDGGRPARVVLLFHPDTGAFMGEEHILITKYGDGPYDHYLNVKIPAVIAYTAVLAAGAVATDK